jgi:hypothetical protein
MSYCHQTQKFIQRACLSPFTQNIIRCLSYEQMPYENNIQDIKSYLAPKGKVVDFGSIPEYLIMKSPIIRTGPNILGRDMVWVMNSDGIQDVIRQEGVTPGGVGNAQLPIYKYNQENLNGKLWAWSAGEEWRKRRMVNYIL